MPNENNIVMLLDKPAKQRVAFWDEANKPTCPPRTKLNAFAVFMGEWAAKIKKAARS